MDGFYLREADGSFQATAATTSPWDDRFQHAGPPLALIARTVDERFPNDDMRMGRMTIEIFGPIPKVDLRIDTRVLRPGKRIELIEARLHSGDKEVLVANVWRFARLPLGVVPEIPVHVLARPLPGPGSPMVMPAKNNGYFAAFEWRSALGASREMGPAAVWCRTELPLFAGEAQQSRDVLLALADSANGISLELPLDTWLSIPSSVTVSLARDPAGEWAYLDATTQIGPDGRGVTTGILGDHAGVVGNIVQALLVSPRA